MFVKYFLLVGVDHCISGFVVSQLTRNTRQGKLGNDDDDFLHNRDFYHNHDFHQNHYFHHDHLHLNNGGAYKPDRGKYHNKNNSDHDLARRAR